MLALLLMAAQLNIGVYYTFPAETITLNNRAGEARIEKAGIDIKKAVNELLNNTEAVINKEVFGGRKAVELKAVFIEYWHIENPPLVGTAIDFDAAISLVEKLQHSPPPDLIIMIFAGEMVVYDPYEKRFDKASGAARMRSQKSPNGLYGDIIGLANFFSAKNKDATLRHELGHMFGLADTDCSKLIIMCGDGRSGRKIDESYKKAWRDFYFARTGQRFKPSE